jgi:alpha-D-ribose 1-methylphosphonate 5-triphosphate synthase subunit PhnH
MRASSQPAVERGFRDPVMESQAVFRLCLEALSRPCRPIDIGSELL